MELCFAILFALCVNLSHAVSSHWQNLTSRRGSLRELELTQSCDDAIVDLSNNLQFRFANATKTMEFENLNVDSICIVVSEREVHCVVDYENDALFSNGEFADACTHAGGWLERLISAVTCSSESGQKTIRFDVRNQECLPASCPDIESTAYDGIKALAIILANRMAPSELGSGAMCRKTIVHYVKQTSSAEATSFQIFQLVLGVLVMVAVGL